LTGFHDTTRRIYSAGKRREDEQVESLFFCSMNEHKKNNNVSHHHLDFDILRSFQRPAAEAIPRPGLGSVASSLASDIGNDDRVGTRVAVAFVLLLHLCTLGGVPVEGMQTQILSA